MDYQITVDGKPLANVYHDSSTAQVALKALVSSGAYPSTAVITASPVTPTASAANPSNDSFKAEFDRGKAAFHRRRSNAAPSAGTATVTKPAVVYAGKKTTLFAGAVLGSVASTLLMILIHLGDNVCR
jgi:hypothetical protein